MPASVAGPEDNAMTLAGIPDNTGFLPKHISAVHIVGELVSHEVTPVESDLWFPVSRGTCAPLLHSTESLRPWPRGFPFGVGES